MWTDRSRETCKGLKNFGFCNCDLNNGCNPKGGWEVKKDARRGEDNAEQACCECGGGNRKL